MSNIRGGWTGVINDGRVAVLDIVAADIAVSRHTIPTSGTIALSLLAIGVALLVASRLRPHQ